MKSIFVPIDAQNRSADDIIQPKEWSQAINTLINAKILPASTPQNLKGSELLDIIKEKHPVEQYNFSWEVFWMVTQYTPPPMFDWENFYNDKECPPKLTEFYSICSKHLIHALNNILRAFTYDSKDISLYPELRFDIAKVRCVLADPKKNLLADIGNWNMQKTCQSLPKHLADYCWNTYKDLSVSSKQEHLKSLQQYPDIMKYEMASELMQQLCSETYAKVFHLLVSMNQYLWPIT